MSDLDLDRIIRFFEACETAGLEYATALALAVVAFGRLAAAIGKPVGDGVTDDTAALQAFYDELYGR